MKNVLSLALFLIVFLGVGALAFAAAPQEASTPEDVAVHLNAQAGSSAAAPTATQNYNFIGLPLDSSDSITPFKASGLAAYHGAGVAQVLQWNPSLQIFSTYIPSVSPPFEDFDLEVGGAYMLLVDSSSSSVLSFVGDVPAQGSISHAIAPAASGCSFDSLTIPLDRSDLTNASDLATDLASLAGIDSVEQVSVWDAASQSFDVYIPGVSPPFSDFDVQIGYPYFVCTNGTSAVNWN